MDKYTIDLDQLLDDFEYSELTDQHSHREKSSAAAKSLPPNPVTKHSINNVFHSLNEYLNTNVTKGESVPTNADNNSNDNNVPTSENQTATEDDNKSAENVDLSDNNCNNSIAVEEEGTVLLPDEKYEEFPVEEEKLIDIDCEIECPAELVNKCEDQLSSFKEIEDLTIDFGAGAGDDVKSETNDFAVPDDVKTEDCDTVKEENDCSGVKEELTHEEVPNEVKIEEPEEDLISNEIAKSSDDTEVKDAIEDEKEDQVVGFTEDLQVDDGELVKMLEDLEKEHELDKNEELVKSDEEQRDGLDKNEEMEKRDEELAATSEEREEIKEEEATVESKKEMAQRPQDLPLNNEKKRKIDLIGDPGSTPYNNVYVNKTMNKKEADGNDSDGEYSSASPTFSDMSTDSTSTASTVSVGDIEAQNKAPTEPAVSTSEQQTADDTEPKIVEEIVPETGQGDAATASQTSVVQPSGSSSNFLDKSWLGKEAPLWIPDSDASACLHCDMKFTMIKRRHHCRACGLVLCSKCCNLKYRLEYLDAEARVCHKCYAILNNNNAEADSLVEMDNPLSAFRPNPNNPSEYCSTVSPLQQMEQSGTSHDPPAVMVPVGVLKRKGSNKSKTNKSVMFCDGIAPGSDLTNLDNDFNYHQEGRSGKKSAKAEAKVSDPAKTVRNGPKMDTRTRCFIPSDENGLPPTVSKSKTVVSYSDCLNSPSVVEMLKNETLTFAINSNLFVHARIINMSCCINKEAWCFATEGLINVGNDEIIILLEFINDETTVPKDVFFHVHNVYVEAVKGTSVKELGISLHDTANFLGSKNHAGFVYIKPTFQCLENVIKPKEPFLIGILIHRWETPWAKLFPLRLVLRLGAEYRYYPSPVISTRHRDSVFVEIGHTIINLLADFRNYTYTLPQIRGLTIHMEDKNTTVVIPKNRYDQVMKSLSNSEDHILAFGGNFSPEADSHLVCIQDTQGNENSYTTHAINIHNKPRKITGASFIIFNGALKPSSGLTAKSNIVEDGLMIQVPPEHMAQIRDSLRAMKDHKIACGPVDAASDETVSIVWGENDIDFNVGIKSPVDEMAMGGIPSIRVHNGKDFVCTGGNRLIRWTEVFIIQNSEENPKNQDPVDISKVSESIAKASCTALVKYLDLLVSNSCQKIAIRVNLDAENVSYAAGSNGTKLAPIYMKSLDNELVPVLHRLTANGLEDNVIVLELIFRILNS